MNVNYNNGQIALTVGPMLATISRHWNGTVQASFDCPRDMATDIGVFLLRATGSDSSWGEKSYSSFGRTLDIAIEDGIAIITIDKCNSGDELTDSDVIDLATRLIVFGGYR